MSPAGPRFLLPDWPAPAHVRAAVSLRIGGISGGGHAGFNLASHVGDDPAAVHGNRQLLCRCLTLPAEPLWLEQVHGCEVAGACHGPTPRADASVTQQRGDVRAVLTADCLPVLFTNRWGTVAGVAHAGWRGLAAGVLEATVAALGCAPAEVLAWLGPAIGPQAFEVGEDVRAAFLAHDPAAAGAFVSSRPDHYHCDLYALASQRLTGCGVTTIYGGGFCTYSDSQRFFSYRRDRITGRMATLIWLA
jgi:hypothetical protein